MDSFWQRRFRSDVGLIGKTVMLSGHPFTVVGVTTPDFRGILPIVPDVWVPLMMQRRVMRGSDLLSERTSRFLDVVGRLNPGVSMPQAQMAVEILHQQLAVARGEGDRNSGILLEEVSLIPREARKKVMTVALLVMIVVGLVLLIACVNVTNLSLARSIARRREVAVRLALGARRSRVIRQLLTETLLLGLFGGLFGLVLGLWMARLITLGISPPDGETLAFDLTLDPRIFSYALGLSVVTGLMVGFIPALRTTGLNLVSALKDQPKALGHQSSRKSRLQSLLVITQTAVCLVLLIVAGLLIRGLRRAQATDPGFESKHVLVVHADVLAQRYDRVRAAEWYRSVTERLQALPGVHAVGLAQHVPLGETLSSAAVRVEGANQSANQLSIGVNVVSPTFFETLNIPILRGRSFDEQETKGILQTAIVNEVLAQRLWPGQDPVGKRFRGNDSDVWTEVVGVARNTRNSRLWEADQAYAYFPYSPLSKASSPAMEILVRTEGDPRLAVPGVRHAIQELDQNLRPTVSVLEKNLERWIMPSRTVALFSTALGLLALTLTAIGLYGVVSFIVVHRTHEIGLRMALGARQRDVLLLVVRQGLRTVLVGIAFGVVGAVVIARTLSHFLFGLSSLDPVSFGGMSLFMIGIALLACFIPAQRAMKVDPIVALRYE